MANNKPTWKTTPSNVTTRDKDSFILSRNKVCRSVEINPDGKQVDAFGRIRVTEPTSIFNSQSRYDTDRERFYEKVSSDGTILHLPNESAQQMIVSTTSGSEVIRQSREYLHYQPGKSQLALITYSFGTSLQFSQKRVGYFDNDNGVFLLNKNGSLFIVLRSKVSGSVVDNEVARANWNIDKFDGLGESGIEINAEKMNILQIELSWLGTGQVAVGFILDKIPYTAHVFRNSNINDSTYMTSATLPVRWQINSAGTNTQSDSMRAICSTVISEGGLTLPFGVEFSTYQDTELNIGTSYVPVLSIRPKSTFRGLVNRMFFEEIAYRLNSRSNDAYFKVTINSQLTGANWQSVDESSGIEFDSTSTGISGGIVKDINLVSAGDSFKVTGVGAESVLGISKLTLDIDGNNPEILTISAKSRTGNADVLCNYRWKEVR